jgi:M6 family metalloprotease-like protein
MMKRASFTPVLAGALLVAALVPALAAQAPPRRWERPGFDFTPEGVWRTRARQVREARLAALARGDMNSLNAALEAPGATGARLAITGVMRVPIFLVTPNNRAAPFPREQYEEVLLAPVPPAGRPFTVRTFYEEMSNGLFSVQGDVFDWLTLEQADTYYEGGCNGLCSNGHVQQLMQEALSAHDGAVDFGQYDNDGPDGIPNSGDDDGFVDVAVFVHAESGGECGGSNIWAHRFFYQGWGGGPFVTNDPRRDSNGNPLSGQFIRVSNYTIQSGVGGSTSCNSGAIMPVGTVSHETGHGLGLPDFYDTIGNDADDSEGIGEWGLMGSGNYASSLSPAHMEGFSRMQLGWVTVAELASAGTWHLGPYTTGDTIFRINPTVTNTRNEYWLVENRQGVLGDSALIARRGAAGLLIWHVDPVRYAQGLFSNSVNTGAVHALDLEEADGIQNLRSSVGGIRNRGDAGDPWPGSTGKTVFGSASNPSPRLNSTGDFAGFVMDSIAIVGLEARFRLRFGGLTVVRGSDPLAEVRVRGTAYNTFSGFFSDGDTLSLSADLVQTTPDGLRRFTFVSWSNGGAREHVAALLNARDTIVATFTRENRVRVSVAGNGAVTAPGMPPDSFLAATDSILLTAVAPPGNGFVGWSGDTSTAAPALRLRAGRAWTVQARFVAVASVVDQLLMGGGALSQAEISQLDLLGNANGRLDLGDVVAWLDRTGTALSPAQAARLFGGRTR